MFNVTNREDLTDRYLEFIKEIKILAFYTENHQEADLATVTEWIAEMGKAETILSKINDDFAKHIKESKVNGHHIT